MYAHHKSFVLSIFPHLSALFYIPFFLYPHWLVTFFFFIVTYFSNMFSFALVCIMTLARSGTLTLNRLFWLDHTSILFSSFILDPDSDTHSVRSFFSSPDTARWSFFTKKKKKK